MSEAASQPTPTSTSTSGAEALRAHEAALFQAQHGATVARFRRVVTFGAIAWPLFLGPDLLALATYGRNAPTWLVLGPRLLYAFVPFATVLWLSRAKSVTPRQVIVVDQIIYGLASATIGVMCLSLGGLESSYLPGICLVITARMFSLAYTWKRALAANALPALAGPMVVVAGALASDTLRPELSNPNALATFALYFAYILFTAVFMAVGSHLIATLRNELSAERSIGRYKLRKRLGLGGMGEVWAAWHAGLKRDVALKILRPGTGDATAAARFEREVRATSELTHPNTVRVFDYGTTDDGLLYYAMELLEGDDLDARVKRVGRLPAAQAVYLLQQAARALSEAHARGIVHRDVKPENLFITAAGGEGDFVKVLDFGIARIESAEAELQLTSAETVVGTPRYMAPEVMRGQRATARADVYGLGAVLHFALTGKPPFDAPTKMALVAEVLAPGEVPPIDVPGVSYDLSQLVARALSKDPEARFADAAALADALRKLPEVGAWQPPRVELSSITPGAMPIPAALPPTPAPKPEPVVTDNETVETVRKA